MNEDQDVVSSIVRRADERFATHQQRVFAATDRTFGYLMIAQWVFGVFLALVISPLAWAGKTSTVHPHVYIALLLGGVLSGFPVLLAFKRPGWVVTRHVMVISQMLWSALLIHLTGGRIETHFHVFGSLGFISYYRDWKLMVTATLVVATDHLVRGMLWPESVYGIPNPAWWRFLEHAGWVVYCDVFLTLACLRGVAEMRQTAEREAEIEALSAAG